MTTEANGSVKYDATVAIILNGRVKNWMAKKKKKKKVGGTTNANWLITCSVSVFVSETLNVP